MVTDIDLCALTLLQDYKKCLCNPELYARIERLATDTEYTADDLLDYHPDHRAGLYSQEDDLERQSIKLASFALWDLAAMVVLYRRTGKHGEIKQRLGNEFVVCTSLAAAISEFMKAMINAYLHPLV